MDVVGVSLLSLCYILKSISYRLNWKYELQNPFVRVEFAEHKKKKKNLVSVGFLFSSQNSEATGCWLSGMNGAETGEFVVLFVSLFNHFIEMGGKPSQPFQKKIIFKTA